MYVISVHVISEQEMGKKLLYYYSDAATQHNSDSVWSLRPISIPGYFCWQCTNKKYNAGN